MFICLFILIRSRFSDAMNGKKQAISNKEHTEILTQKFNSWQELEMTSRTEKYDFTV